MSLFDNMRVAAMLSSFAAASQAVMDTAPWSSLNTSLAGRLQATTPLALPCFSSYNGQPHTVDVSSCTAIRDNYTSNSLRTSRVEAYMNLQNELCLSEPANTCILDNTVLPAPMPAQNSTCRQGSVPSYHITVESASDVTTVFDFARNHGVELSVKNRGHDYMTRSSGRGTLTLYTDNLTNMSFDPSFIPEGCNNAIGTAAITLGPGVDVSMAIDFAEANNSTILTAYSPTVAVSTGWVLGGGHSVLSSVYGLGVDRVLSYDIVTPDGQFRRASACSNPDLFWTLRGGGGGTFGVVLSATHKVEPRMPIAYASIKLPSNSTVDQTWQWLELLVQESLAWGQAGWGGHLAGTYLTYFNPLPEYTSDNGTAARAAFSRASAFVEAIGGTSQIFVVESFHALWSEDLAPGFTAQGGKVSILSSQLLSRDLFATQAGQESIIAYLRSIVELGFDPTTFYVPVTTPYVWNGTSVDVIARAKKETAVTARWYDSLWSASVGRALSWNSTYEERLSTLTDITNITRQMEVLNGQVGSKPGSYLNEANPFLSDWVESWWGQDNYEKLVTVKNKYDPDRLLKCWKCVGFEESDMDLDRFGCQARLQRNIDAAFADAS